MCAVQVRSTHQFSEKTSEKATSLAPCNTHLNCNQLSKYHHYISRLRIHLHVLPRSKPLGSVRYLDLRNALNHRTRRPNSDSEANRKKLGPRFPFWFQPNLFSFYFFVKHLGLRSMYKKWETKKTDVKWQRRQNLRFILCLWNNVNASNSWENAKLQFYSNVIKLFLFLVCEIISTESQPHSLTTH